MPSRADPSGQLGNSCPPIPHGARSASSIADYRPSAPFDATRTSVPGTTFVILQAPLNLSVGPGPTSWGQARTELMAVDGCVLGMPAQTASGTLHYQAIFRAFGDGNQAGCELRSIGGLALDLDNTPANIRCRFPKRLDCSEFQRYADALFTFEVDLSWEPRQDARPLALTGIPEPFGP